MAYACADRQKCFSISCLRTGVCRSRKRTVRLLLMRRDTASNSGTASTAARHDVPYLRAGQTAVASSMLHQPPMNTSSSASEAGKSASFIC